MPPKSKTSNVGRRIMGLLRNAAEEMGGAPLTALCHRVLVQHLPGSRAIPYAVCLAPDDGGTFLVTCRELPDLLAFGDNEDEAY